MKGLQTRAWIALAALSVVMGLFIFMPAGTTRFWEGWAYLAIFVVASGSTTAYLLKKDPALLARRLRGGSAAETRSAQKLIMPALSLGVLAILVTAALDRRFGWSDAPRFLVFAGQALVATGMLVIFLTYRENTFTSATIEIAEDHTVISTGVYSLVRHPMYAGAGLFLIGTPLALGSYWGLLPILWLLPFLVWRMNDEEKMLVAELPGYVEYQRKTPHRLVPLVW